MLTAHRRVPNRPPPVKRQGAEMYVAPLAPEACGQCSGTRETNSTPRRDPAVKERSRCIAADVAIPNKRTQFLIVVSKKDQTMTSPTLYIRGCRFTSIRRYSVFPGGRAQRLVHRHGQEGAGSENKAS